MSKYILTSTQFVGEVVFIFNAKMRLVYMDVRAELSTEQHEFLMSRVPAYVAKLSTFRTKTTTITEMPIDLSFDNFWNVYNYKEGTKKRAASLWNALSKTNRILAIEYIRIYNGKLAQKPGIDRMYPETYLSSERWNNQ